MKKLKTLSLGKSDSKFGIDLFTDSPVFLANLEKLHLESVSIKDVHFNKSKLKTLTLINCGGFRDDLLLNFSATALARLEKVDLRQSAIRDGGLAYLSNLALGLQELILDDCVLVVGDFTLSKEAFSNLQVLSLKGSVVGPPRIGDQGIYEFLIRAKNLRELYLNQNSLITGSTFEKLPIGSLLFLKKLTLGLHFDKIGQLPEGALSRLNELHLYQTNISYEKLSSLILARTKDLKILGLKRCDNLESENLG